MQDLAVNSWNELNDALYQEFWNDRLRRHRSNWAFRGLPDASFDLQTSLMRLGGDYARQEADLLRNFRKYAFHETSMTDSPWNWLALAAHHSLPTRLLDWTYSPFVALHFATEDPTFRACDSVVWCVDYVKSNELLPSKLKKVLELEDSNIFTAEMLGEAAGSLDDLGKLSSNDYVVFFEPPSLDDRIVNQYALFTMMCDPSSRLDKWLSEHPDLCRRIVIPASLKWEVRDKLDQANVTERVLFPGLDGLSSWLRRYYSPREP